MAHGIMIPSYVQAKNIDALNRSFKASAALDNGNVILLSTGIASGEKEVFAATLNGATPVTTGLWMVGEPEVVVTAAKYKGLDPDPRNFEVASGEVGTAFKIKKYDVVELSADCFTNAVSTNTFVDVTASSGKLTFAASSTSTTVGKLLEAKYIPIGVGYPTAQGGVASYLVEFTAE